MELLRPALSATQQLAPTTSATAVVVGACGHGLAITRALSRAGVPVIVLESNRSLPGAYSRYGRIRWVPEVSGPGLLDALCELSRERDAGERLILFVTNDTMVREVGLQLNHLPPNIVLSWGSAVSQVLHLLDKTSLARHCQKAGLNYPRTELIGSPHDAEAAFSNIGLPMIIKPSRPLSGFKTFLPRTLEELGAFIDLHSADLPFIAQRWIPGDDTTLYFVAQYRVRGQATQSFVGRKLRSRPMGHTTVAEPTRDANLIEVADRFFAELDFAGPVSLELKRDPDGTWWVIEPTVGRTDFWVGLCIANGVNLPMLEFADQAGFEWRANGGPRAAVWFNEDRDPLALVWYLAVYHGKIRRRKPVFVYASITDPVPLLLFASDELRSLTRRIMRRLGIIRTPRAQMAS